MARTPLFAATLLALPLFACDAPETESVHFRSDGSNGHHKKHGKKGKKSKKHGHIYPGKHWKVDDPEDHGFSDEGFEQLAEVAEQVNSTCVVVIHDGVLVGEWYWDGFGPSTPIPDIWSATKSLTGAAIGVADKQGLIDIHDPASEYIPQWQGTDSEDVTIFDLLTHTSGREWEFFSDIAILEQPDQTGYALSFGQELPPGTKFDYSNLGAQALEAVLENATGGDVEEYFQAKLFDPIGMEATLGRDAAGNPQVYTGLSATCRDIARFGYLYLRKGRWKGKQVLPKSWVEESTQAATDLNDAYGLLWWLNEPGHVVLSTIPTPEGPFKPEFYGKLLPSAPDEMYMAFGAFGQLIAVDPENELVVVRTTLDYDLGDPHALGDMDAILAALYAAQDDDDDDDDDDDCD